MKKFFSITLLLCFVGIAFADNIDISENITTNVTWTSDNDYYLDGFIFVEDGATLTIEPGTVIRGYAGTGENASALIIKRGGKIMAKGTSSAPIIFTSEKDGDLTQGPEVKGSWGGLILLGKGTHNNLTNDNGIEGVPEAENAYYGGDDEDDNSGVLRYVSIRHGGSELAPDEEINGLTLGAVGSGTSISFVEIMGNDDDGIEWFGGSVNLKYVVVNDVADDSYDIDEGFNGKIQFAYAVQATDGTGDNFGEHDGGPSSNRWGEPYATPVFSNVTYIGAGTSGGNRTLTLREFFGGQYHNSIFAEQEKGIRVEYVPEFTDGAKGGAFTQWSNGNLKLENNIFQNIADGTAAGIFSVYSPEDDNDQPIYTVPQDSTDAFVNYANDNNTFNSGLGISRDNPVPSADVSSPSFEGLDSYFDVVEFQGAFNPCVTSGLWAGGWTYTFANKSYDASLENCETGIYNNKITINSSVYPNPASSYITIEFENASNDIFTLNLYNSNGQVVYTNLSDDSRIDIDVTPFNSGLYIYRITNENATLTTSGRIIIKYSNIVK